MLSEETKALLFSWRGRMNRKIFIIIQLIIPILILILASICAGILYIAEMLTGADMAFLFALFIIFLGIPAIVISIWISIVTTIKRLHDTDYSGWWYLINFVPYIGGLIIFIWTWFIKGTKGPNRFGEDPIANHKDDIFQLIFSFKGRLNRQPFINIQMFLLVNWVIWAFFVSAVGSRLQSVNIENFDMFNSFETITNVLTAFLTVLSIWINLATSAKRLHDMDRSAWWLLLHFIPFGALILVFMTWFIKGTKGPNRFGEDLLTPQKMPVDFE